MVYPFSLFLLVQLCMVETSKYVISIMITDVYVIFIIQEVITKVTTNNIYFIFFWDFLKFLIKFVMEDNCLMFFRMSVKHLCYNIWFIFFDNFNPTTPKAIIIIIIADIKVFSLFILYIFSNVETTPNFSCKPFSLNKYLVVFKSWDIFNMVTFCSACFWYCK